MMLCRRRPPPLRDGSMQRPAEAYRPDGAFARCWGDVADWPHYAVPSRRTSVSFPERNETLA